MFSSKSRLTAVFFAMTAVPSFATEIVFTRTEEPSGCEIKIRLGGYCCGIDVPEQIKIQSYVEQSTTIDRATEYSFTYDGQSTLCLQISDPQSVEQAYRDLRALIPASGARSIMLGSESRQPGAPIGARRPLPSPQPD